MTLKTPGRILTRAPDLPSYIPSVPPFEGEDKFDAAKVGQAFLEKLSQVVKDKDWNGFEDLFDENCFWKDALTLTFDKRTLHGKKPIAEAWKMLAETRKPTIHTTPKEYGLGLPIALNRLAPTLASLDVPFTFETKGPKSNCVGLAKLIPQPDGGWKIWVLSTLFISLQEHPFGKLPRETPSLISNDQRGHSKAHGLPKLPEGAVLDAVVIGASTLGVANTIALDSAGANVVAFDSVSQAGGNWSEAGKAFVILHHLASMMTLPQFPIPSDYSEDMGGEQITRYISAAVEALKLPVFCGINVVSNTYDEATQLWTVLIEDLATKQRATVTARNLVLCMGSIASAANPRYPNLMHREAFAGPVQHAVEYKDAAPFKEKFVLIVGASNSAHDIARSLVEGGAREVTVLQRGPTAFFEWDKIKSFIEGPYSYGLDLATADFLFSMLPLGIGRDMARGAMAAIEATQEEFYKKLEGKGYSIQRNRDFVTKTLETRNGSIFMDRQKSLELVFEGKVKVARGEAVRYAEDGIVVNDNGEEKKIEAEGIVLATGFEDVDMPWRWIESGFLKSNLAEKLENPCTLDIDQEGEFVGLFTDSGHPHLYVGSTNVVSCRWISTLISAQVVADVNGEFPSRLPR
ncbi:hypothetical protein GE09DRAFT_990658, partial [Coniochaeta sp. 2T2.1]